MTNLKDVKTLFFQNRTRLLIYCFLLLFVELTLIRWIGANIFLLAFFPNFILLASFLGIGIGFVKPKSKHFFSLAPMCLAIVILFSYYFRYQYHVRIDPNTDDLDFYGRLFTDNLIPVWFSLPIIFLMVMAVMMMIADNVARTFQKLPPLEAYRFDILGSLLGVITFSGLAYLQAKPLWWGVIIVCLFFLLNKQEGSKNKWISLTQVIALAIMLLILGKASTINNEWSPYYKIGVEAYSHGRYVVSVNGSAQQFIESVDQRKIYKPFYFYPYEHQLPSARLNNVLVIGAGTGGDVAIALAQGAQQVDAVEIDPVLYELGKKLNPNRPYFDKRVNIYIDDGRAFLQQHNKRYDMIIFALPDSMMVITGQSSLRLENYLFTLESIQAVKNHLNPGGIFTMYNYYREKWMVDRLANTLFKVFKQQPCLDTSGSKNHWLSVLSVSRSASSLQCSSYWEPTQNPNATPTTDNHPFLYLKENTLTSLYIEILLFIVLTAHFSLRAAGVAYRSIKHYPDLFLMGAAFLLLETKNISHFALLFGSTWLVNALVFIGILATIYLAIEITSRNITLRPVYLYSLLFLSLVLAWLVPSDVLLSLNFTLRFLFGTFLAFGPVFLANLIFAERFNLVGNSTEAFSANLLGAVGGGLMEYATLLIGYRHLLILISLFYVLAILWMQHERIKEVNV